MKKTFNRLLLITWLLNVYDLIVTLIGTMSLNAEELNPLMRAALQTGPTAFVASKLSVHAAVCWVLDRRLEDHPRKTWATLCVILVIFTIVSIWNTVVLMSLL